MSASDFLRTALEAGITTLLVLFAGYLLFGASKRSPALYVLAAFSGTLGLSMGINIFGGQTLNIGVGAVLLFCEMLVGPLVFIYVAQAARMSPSPTPWYFAHLLPGVAALGLYFNGVLTPIDMLAIGSNTAYLTATAWTLWHGWNNYAPRRFRYFLVYLICGLFLVILAKAVIAATVTSGGSFRATEAYLALLVLGLAVSVLILFTALRHPDMLSAPGASRQYEQDTDSLADLDLILLKIDALMARDRPFLQEGLKIEDLARMVDCPPREISQAINRGFDMNFPQFINQFRIQEAARQLDDQGSSGKTITTIMYDVGFGSKSAFNREFKKAFGISPRAFRNR